MYLDKKAIALINAPKSCGECCFQKGLTVYGYACGIAKTMNKDTRNRPDWCPLIPLPKRHTAPKTATGYEIGYEDGWNDCLDKIAGGERYEKFRTNIGKSSHLEPQGDVSCTCSSD